MSGYTPVNEEGSTILPLKNELDDYADGVAIVQYLKNEDPVLLCTTSNKGIVMK